MHRFGRLGRLFAPVGGIGTLCLGTSAVSNTASNNPASVEYVTASSLGHPHATTHKDYVQDKMEQVPHIMKSALEWPRLEETWDDAEQEKAARSNRAIIARQAARLREARQAHDDQERQRERDQQPRQEQQRMAAAPAIPTQAQTEATVAVAMEGELAQYIDHTALKAMVSKDEITELCQEAMEHKFASVCVNPVWVQRCSNLLKDSSVKVCTVIGFPLGANTTKMKVLEALEAVQEGAKEIDMVISVGRIKSGEWDLVELEVASVVQAVQGPMLSTNAETTDDDRVIVKVILETCMLSKDEIVKACEVCVRAGADFVKTSTGFGSDGATIENVKLMKQTVTQELNNGNGKENSCKVKASGGIRNSETAKEMVKAGASRIGTSSGINIVSAKDDDTTSDY